MDIIAAHQQGLIEQLDHEVAALAGGGRDHGQRAMVLHHLYDHSGGGHGWALAEARRELWILSGLAALQRKLGQWSWRGAYRDQERIALERLADAFGEACRARTAAAYRAYRLSATKALRAEAERSLPSALLVAFDQRHTTRRAGDDFTAEARVALAEESERLAEAAVDLATLDAAWIAIDASGLRRAARRLLGAPALARAAARDQRRGSTKVERLLLSDAALPVSFRANPAQHFYALQHMLRERQRKQWREACDREPDAFELAA
jgi:hypothetical protein